MTVTTARTAAIAAAVVSSLAIACCKQNKGRDPLPPSATPRGSEAAPSGAEPVPTRVTETGERQVIRPSLVRSDLPQLARDILREPMRRHGDHMESLLWTSLMLDHDSIVEIAGWLAEEPRISRPTADDPSALNAAFPAAFFDLQDRLHQVAEELAAAAREGDEVAVAESYGQLAETCVACHSLYLKLPADE